MILVYSYQTMSFVYVMLTIVYGGLQNRDTSMKRSKGLRSIWILKLKIVSTGS